MRCRDGPRAKASSPVAQGQKPHCQRVPAYRRAGCIERCSSGSREARRSNPSNSKTNPDVLSHAKSPQGGGDQDRPSNCSERGGQRPRCSKAGEGGNPVILPEGVRHHSPHSRARRVRVPVKGRTTRLAWGAPDLATGGTGPMTRLGDLGQIPRPRIAQP